MRRLTPLLLLCAAAALAADPEGTVALQLEPGPTSPIAAPPGTNILCDDLTVVAPEFSEDGSTLQLRARAPGSTLCGVWLGDQKPGGLYRVPVAAKPAELDAGRPDPAAADRPDAAAADRPDAA